ncbi:uracil phosphoribosyltransferase [Stachybotrys elegans]|uniref:uracil phosphoribosyltransferase n=1 Tax=Stachybotrys elegans TaxID=80388 RepID=A0A8K0SHT3_9HYPO|nr:uracil phosphoribosyltransferase [Stachybotrys elegans]
MTSTVTVLDDATFNSKFEQLRDPSLPPRRVRQLVRELTAILAKLAIRHAPTNEPIAIMVILRSGMSMMDDFVAAFPDDADISVYHLGIFRDRQTLMPVEYYNKLGPRSANLKTGYILDPLLATGGTAEAAISIVRDWGLEKVTFVSLLGSKDGLSRVSSIWPDGLDLVVGKVDNELDNSGYVKPGVGDIGDRLYGTA